MDDMAAYEPIEREPVQCALPRLRRAHQPAALLGRDPDRLLARRCSSASGIAAASSSSSPRRRRPTRGAPRTSTRACTTRAYVRAVPRRRPRRGRRADPRRRLGRRPRRGRRPRPDELGSTTHIAVLDAEGNCAIGHLLERHRLRRGRARHRGAPQQHARRGGPQPARLPPDPAGSPGELDDVPDARAARRRDRARAGQRRLQPDPLGDPADRRQGARAGDGRGRRRRSRGGCTSRRARSRPSRASIRGGLDDLERRGVPVVRWKRQNLYFGGVQAVARDPAGGELSGGGDPRRGGAVAFG